MEFYKKFANLKVSENLFKDVKFYVTGSLPDWILQLLLSGGGKQESHITDFMTHLITGSNPDENEIDEVKDIYDKPVVTQSWIVYSVKCVKQLPVEGFMFDRHQLFSGVKASVSKLGIEDSCSVWGLITFYGGKCTIDFDHTCTHLVIGRPEGIKYKRALEKPVLIVTPDWVIDTIDDGERKDELYYHPKLLNLSPVSPSSSYKTPRSKTCRKRNTISSAEMARNKVLTPMPSAALPLIPVSAPVDTKQEREERKQFLTAKLDYPEKSLFDSLIFSDDEEDGSDGERKSLLDQLKSSQPWKHSPTPPLSSVPISSVSTSLVASANSGSSVSTASLDSKPPVSITYKSVVASAPISHSSGIEIHSTVSSATPTVTTVPTPSISITSQSASVASLLPSALIGSLLTSSSTAPPSGVSTVSNISALPSVIPTTASIISTSEIDVSFISRHALSSSIAAGPTTLPHSLSEQGTIASAPATAGAASLPMQTVSVSTSESVQAEEISGQPLSRLLRLTESPIIQTLRMQQPTGSVTLTSLPPFSSAQSSNINTSSHFQSSLQAGSPSSQLQSTLPISSPSPHFQPSLPSGSSSPLLSGSPYLQSSVPSSSPHLQSSLQYSQSSVPASHLQTSVTLASHVQSSVNSPSPHLQSFVPSTSYSHSSVPAASLSTSSHLQSSVPSTSHHQSSVPSTSPQLLQSVSTSQIQSFPSVSHHQPSVPLGTYAQSSVLASSPYSQASPIPSGSPYFQSPSVPSSPLHNQSSVNASSPHPQSAVPVTSAALLESSVPSNSSRLQSPVPSGSSNGQSLATGAVNYHAAGVGQLTNVVGTLPPPTFISSAPHHQVIMSSARQTAWPSAPSQTQGVSVSNHILKTESLNQNSGQTPPPNVVITQSGQIPPLPTSNQISGGSVPPGVPASLPSVSSVIAATSLPLQQLQSIGQSSVPFQLIRQGSVSVVSNQVQRVALPSIPSIHASPVSVPGQLPVATAVKPSALPGPAPQLLSGQLVQQSNGGVTISSTTNMPQHQVHSVAIPGAVVRLPAGVTHQQLQMMSNEERQRFLEQLHKKQIQEQRVVARPGKPISAVQYKALSTGTVRYPSAAIRAPQANQPTVVAQPQSPQPAGAWPQQARVHPGPAVVPGSPVAAYVQAQVRTQVPTTSGSSWYPVTQQQQFTSSAGAPGRVLVGQPGQTGWQQQQQQQQSVQQVVGAQPQPQTQGLLPQHLQQLHAQQLRQHFPHLTQQEAQQLIQTIPSHMRELQSRDNAGRLEYLSQLDIKERQVVNHFYLRRHQQQMLQRQQQLQAQQQAQLKIGAPQHSPNSWQQQPQAQQSQQQGSPFPAVSPHARPVPGRPLPQGYAGQAVVSPGQGSPHLVQGGQVTPPFSPLASPHGHSPIQRPEGGPVLPHPAIQGSQVAQSLVNPQNLVNPKTKTALANLVTNRLSGTVHQGVLSQGAQSPIEVATHIVQKQGLPPEGVQAVGPGGEQVVVYQRRTLANITGTVTNNIIRPAGPVSGPSTSAAVYPRSGQVGQPGASSGLAPATPHYLRPHLFGHDINTMLPRELCMVGCVFYIADYYSDIAPEVINTWKTVIQQHGGEVINLYDSARVTHMLCQHQKSPVFQQAVRENKRCITIYWVNDILIRGKMAPPWQAIHLPTPFGKDDKPMKDLLVSITGFENDERTTIKLMLQLAGAKYTGYFSKHNHLLVCKKFEGVKVNKARDWKRAVVNGAWLSEVLLGQNSPPLVYQGTRYQHYLDDPLRIDPSLASHLFNAWKCPISVSKESVEKAKAVREMALRKRKLENDGEQENKRARLEPPQLPPLPSSADSQSDAQKMPEPQLKDPSTEVKPELSTQEVSPLVPLQKQQQQPKIMLSYMKNKEEMEKKILALGGVVAGTNAEMTHLVMGPNHTAPRTVKFLCALSCAQYIVSVQWLIDSYNNKRFLVEEHFSLKMPEFEKVFSFTLSETLSKPNRRELFAGKTFYLTPSVVPSRTWLKEIIDCAGGRVDTKRKSLNEIKERNKDGKYQYICITADDDAHLLRDVIRDHMPVFNSEFVMASVMKQQLDYQLTMFQPSCVKEE